MKCSRTRVQYNHIRIALRIAKTSITVETIAPRLNRVVATIQIVGQRGKELQYFRTLTRTLPGFEA
jgi:hypothetical protein